MKTSPLFPVVTAIAVILLLSMGLTGCHGHNDPVQSATPTPTPVATPVPTPTATPTPQPIVLYEWIQTRTGENNPDTTSGNLGGVAAATTRCMVDNDTGLPNVAAFLSTSSSNIRDLITGNDALTRPVVSKIGMVVSRSWNELWDGGIDMQLRDAGILPARPHDAQWWSGSNADGTWSGTDCQNWMRGDNACEGMLGYSAATDARWIHILAHPCNIKHHVLCIAW